MTTDDKDFFRKWVEEQYTTYKPTQIVERKGDTTFIFNLELPPPKKIEKPQKIHPYIKLANEKETNAKKDAQEIINQRKRCKVFQNIVEQQEKKAIEIARNIRNQNESKLAKLTRRQIELNPRKTKRKNSESQTQARGPPYWPNVIQMSEIFPKKDQKTSNTEKYSRSRSKHSKHASKMVAIIMRQREQKKKQIQSKQEEGTNKMQEQKEVQPIQSNPLDKLLSNEKKSGQSKNVQQNVKPSITQAEIPPNNPKADKQSNDKTLPKGQLKVQKADLIERKIEKQGKDDKADIDDIILKEQMIKKKQEQLRKQKEKLQQQKRIIQQRKKLQKEKQELRQARLNLERRQKEIAEKEKQSSPKKAHNQSRKHQQTKRHQQSRHQSKHRKQSRSSSSSNDRSSQKFNWRKQLQQVTGYNPSDKKYRMRDRQQIRQSNFSRLNEEQKYSRKKGRQQQEEYLKYEKKMKKNYHNHQY